ncbi:MAG: sulfatase-like hydrolase/transferase [Thermomicrobiales bacterium]|nr:sulfatase-like hydrolase/transferase [Thermomicrobiales bacterium]
MQNEDRPNLLFILSDQHAQSVLGCYGDSVVETPNLDRLANKGVKFTSAYCTSPLCTPSRMSLLTGQHPYRNEVWTNQHILDSSIPTFAHALGAAGYRTIHVGRMHSLGPDQHRGFAERYIGDLGGDYLQIGGPLPDRGRLQDTSGPNRSSLHLSGPGQSGYEVYDEYVTSEAINQLNKLGNAQRSGAPVEPFCLSVGYVLPHAPYVARTDAYRRFENLVPQPAVVEPYSESLHPFLQYWRTKCGIRDVTDEEVQRARTAYWALVSNLDAMIGRVVRALEENNLADKTLIVYVSDHGDSVGENGLWWKHTFYDPSVKVPAILSWPGRLPEGQTQERVISTIDIVATMLEIAGAKNMPHADGKSFLKQLQSQRFGTEWANEAFAESCTDDGWYMRMVRKDAWKLNYYHGYEPQLFDLSDDPHEVSDRASDPEVRHVRHELEQLVLGDWDPTAVKQRMEAKHRDMSMIANWVRAVKPADQIPFGDAPGGEAYWLDADHA